MQVDCDLYGLKYLGAAFRTFLVETLASLRYRPSYVDPDIWMRPTIKPDGFNYWKYVLCYVDDVICIHMVHPYNILIPFVIHLYLYLLLLFFLLLSLFKKTKDNRVF